MDTQVPDENVMSSNVSTVRKMYYDDLVKKLEKTGEEYGVPYKSGTKYTQLPVYEIPIGEDFKTGLRFNLDNSRIIKYVIAEEKKRGRSLDPEKPETQGVINEILLKDELYSKDAVKNLKEDLEATGQREPVIISCDGTIWNGNRRISVMKSMYKDTGDQMWARVKGIFLPELSKKELKQLEHRLQLAHTFKEEYDRITLFLDCRKMYKDEGWTLKELEYSFNGRYKEKKIKRFIRQIDLIDEYLMRIDHVGNYPILGEKGAEFFDGVQTHLEREEKVRRTRPPELEKITTEFFAARGGKDSTYMDARHLSKILLDEQTRDTYLANSPIYNNYAEYTTPGEDGREKAFSEKVANGVVSRIKSTYAELVASSADTPLELAEKALKKLDDIKEDDIERDDNTFLEKIDQIESRLQRLRLYVQDV